MNHYAILLIGLATLALCACSDTGTDQGIPNKSLKHSYHFIGGLLSPHTTGAREIFVGMLSPNDQPPLPKLSQDPLLNRLLLNVRGDYLGQFTGNDGAVVHVSDEQGDSVQFLSVGDGFYRDVNSQLQVEAGQKYYLHVKYRGQSMHGETRIPGAFEISDIDSGDTVDVVYGLLRNPQRTDSVWALYTRWTPSSGSAFYRLLAEFREPKRLFLTHSLTVDDQGITFQFDAHDGRLTELDMKVEAVDTNYARIYHPEIDYTGSDDWFSRFSKFGQYYPNLSIEQSSSVRGGDYSVVGVFGSVNSAAITFSARPGK